MSDAFIPRTDRLHIGVALAVALVLKTHYSVATAGELAWILAPTTALVGAATGASFVVETQNGYLSPELNLLIAPVCAGVNFLIAAYCAAAFGLMPLVRRAGRKWAFLAGALGAAYVITVAVNAARILIGLRLRDVVPPVEWMTAADLHRAEGVVVYVSALCGAFLAARALMLRAPGGGGGAHGRG
jgi:exosortase K